MYYTFILESRSNYVRLALEKENMFSPQRVARPSYWKGVKPWMEKNNNITFALMFWVYSVGYVIELPMINKTIEMSTTLIEYSKCTHKYEHIHSNSLIF